VPDPTEFSRAMRRLSRERGVAERGFLGDLRAQDAALDRDLLEEEEREGGTLRNIGATIISPLGAIFDERSRARLIRAGAGAVGSAFLTPAQAIAQIPGVFSEQELATDRAADFIERAREGLFSRAEEIAMGAGLTEKEIADAHATGNFIGFIMPVAAAIKVPGLVMRATAAARGLQAPEVVTGGAMLTRSNLINDLAAGAFFGAVLEPGETPEDRIKHLLRESALFGVGRIVIAGIALPFRNYRNRRVAQSDRDESLDVIIRKLEDGERIEVVSERNAISLARLLSEEEMIASSIQAQNLVRTAGDERALLQAVVDASGSRGYTEGLVRNVGRTFDDANAVVSKFREALPHLKFSTPVRSVDGQGFTVHFGMVGLSGPQLRELKQLGRYKGQEIHKGGAAFLIDEPKLGKDGKIRVITTDGQRKRISPEGATEAPFSKADFSRGEVTIMDDLFDNFSQAVFRQWDKVTQSMSGVVPESALIKMIREGRLRLTDEHRRAFDVSGAITYSEELGRQLVDNTLVGIRYKAVGRDGLPLNLLVSRSPRDPNQWRVTGIESATNRPTGHRTFSTIEEATQWAESLGGQETSRFSPFATIGEVSDVIARQGKGTANLIEEGGSIVSFEDMFDAWARQADLPATAPDLASIRSHFAQRMRETMWRSVPDEDRAVFERVRDQFLELAEAGEITLAGLANARGFTPDRLSGGRVSLRDSRTGARIEFGSEARARDFLVNTSRADNNMLGDPFNMGSGGIGTAQRNFFNSDGIFSPDGSAPPTSVFLKDAPPTRFFRPMRDIFIDIEDALGVPLFTRVFDSLDTGLTRAAQEYEPFARRIGKLWDRLPRGERISLARRWAELDGSDLSLTQASSLLKKEGFNTRQIAAFQEARRIYDAAKPILAEIGVPESQFINLYYSRVLPDSIKHGNVNLDRVFGRGNVPPEFRFFGEMFRTGDMPIQELDPAVVMQQYFRSLFFRKNAGDTYNRARELTMLKTTPKIGDLQPAQRARLETAAGRQLRDDEPVMAEPIRQHLAEFLNTIRGMPNSREQSYRGIMKNFLKMLGVEIEDKAIEEVGNIALANMYGAAMAARPALVARNNVQAYWMAYTRTGSREFPEAIRRAASREGAQEAMDAGAQRFTEAALPFGEAVFSNMMDRIPVEGTGPMSRALAATIRGFMRAGNVTRQFGRRLLLPYTEADGWERAFVYWNQKLHTQRRLDRYEAGGISWEKFLEDGLPFFHRVTKNEFSQRYNSFGREDALRWIGKQAADEADFIYRSAAQPAWLQNTPGRFLGMFATWPINALEVYSRRAWMGTPAQIAAFHVRTLTLVGAFANMGYQTGVNLNTWIGPLSIFGYAGGPPMDNIVQMKRVIEAPIDQKSDALATLATQVGRLSLPGSIAFMDIRDALDQEDPMSMGLRMFLGRFQDDGNNFALEFTLSPDNTRDVYQDPERAAEALRSLEGIDFPRIPLFQEPDR
jgi:hypothetical protein